MPFNPAQLCAVQHKDGPMMVLAGPGSGKTTVIVGRLQYLVETCRVPADKILVITFTRAAAREMEERWRKKTEEAAAQGQHALSRQETVRKPAPVFGTFHSVFFAILRERRGFSAASFIKPEDQRRALKKILSDPQIPFLYTDESAELLLAEISRIKAKGGEACTEGTLGLIYQRYEAVLRGTGLLDFDDMLLLCKRLFLEDKATLLAEQARFQYLLIDEFQDINALQYEIVRLLAEPHENLFIVGDDDQSIYGFRGSVPRLMLNFPKDYPGAKTVLLDINYRSGREIVEASGRLIGKNRERFRKQLTAGRREAGRLQLTPCETEKEEYQKLIAEIRKLHQKGMKLSDMAVLYRTGAEGRPLKEALGKADIPFSVGRKGKEAVQKLPDVRQLPNGNQPSEAKTPKDTAQSADTRGTATEPPEALVLSTYHGSKGLEFETVFLVDVNEGVTPHKKASEQQETLEEERRMFYVAVTRAKQILHILYTKSRYNKAQRPSRFLSELMGGRCKERGAV